MTYTITAVTNDKVRKLVSVTNTTDKEVADLVAAHLEAKGHLVIRAIEVGHEAPPALM